LTIAYHENFRDGDLNIEALEPPVRSSFRTSILSGPNGAMIVRRREGDGGATDVFFGFQNPEAIE